jgi:DNA primase catalytic core
LIEDFRQRLAVRSALFAEVVDACRNILQHDPIAAEARDYLDERLSRRVQAQYGFGYFPPNSQLDFLTDLVDPRILLWLKLMYMKPVAGARVKFGHFDRHNIVMPFRDVYGNIVSLVGRTLLSSDDQKKLGVSKYKYSFNANKQLHLYGMHIAKDAIIKSNCVICVEGQFDCIACQEAGIRNVVACGGANLLPFQFFMLRRYTNNLVLLLDNDEAGRTARIKLKRRYSPYAHVGLMTPPDGFKDMDEFLRNGGKKRREHVVHTLKNLHQQINREKYGSNEES